MADRQVPNPHETASPHYVIGLADYDDPVHAQAVVDLLDAYARDPAGGGKGLEAQARQQLVPGLRQCPTAFSVLAFVQAVDGVPVGSVSGQAVGLINAFEGFSTFAARPLVNVHDVVVHADHRGLGIAARMMDAVVQEARRRGACKLTLEVLSSNRPAMALYERMGFAPYQLDPAMGQALFMQCWL